MKIHYFGATLLLAMTACSDLGRGTPGSAEIQSGTAAGPWNEPYPTEGASRFNRAGLPDVNIAANRQEGALDVSGSGSSELARRSASANTDAPVRPSDSGRNSTSAVTADDILQDRVLLALSSTTPTADPLTQPLSIQTLHNLKISVQNGIVLLRGHVSSLEESKSIEARVREVAGVQDVRNRLEIVRR